MKNNPPSPSISDTEEEIIEELPKLIGPPIQLPVNECSYGVQIFVINVDQGNFICVKNCDTNKIVIIDAGSSNLKFSTLSIGISESLKNIFEDCSISAIIITHLDKDHYNYLTDENFKYFLKITKSSDPIVICGLAQKKDFNIVKEFSISEKTYGIIVNDTSYKIVQFEGIHTKDITVITKQINYSFGYINAFTFCLPNQGIGGYLSKNTCSLVVQLSCKGGNILFTGDATGATFDALVKIPQNHEIFKNTNFLIIPHHGADTEGSWKWLSGIINISKDNFVGAVVSINPMNSIYNQPNTNAVNIKFAMSAKRASKINFIFYDKNNTKKHKKKIKTNDIHAIQTHRCIYEPALLPGNILWIKLENGLSIFDNDAFLANLFLPICSFFTPFTTFWNGKWVSVYSCIDGLMELAKSDHEITVNEAINLTLHLQEMLSAHTAPMITINQFGIDLSAYYEHIIEKIPFGIIKQKNDKLLKKLHVQSSVFCRNYKKKKKRSLVDDIWHTAKIHEVIPPQLAGYQIQDVPSDGNCGIWAILVAAEKITPEELQALMKAYNEAQTQYGPGATWKQCWRILQKASPTAVQEMINFRKESNVGKSEDWVGEEHLPQISEALGKPIVVVYTIDGLPIYTLYSRTEKRGNLLEGKSIEQITIEYPGVIFIYYDHAHRHFQAIVPEKKH